MQHTPEAFFQKKGREIKGLPVQSETFEPLREKKDYDLIEINKDLISKHTPREYLMFVNPDNASDAAITREVQPPHWRTVTTNNVLSTFQRYDGATEPFYIANTKGVGFLKPTVTGHSLHDYATWTPTIKEQQEYKILGLATLGEFRTSQVGSIITVSSFLNGMGMRGELYWAIARLKNLFFKGKNHSVKELQHGGVIPHDFDPYMGVRVMKTNTRIAEMEATDRSRTLFGEAIKLRNREAALYDDEYTYCSLEDSSTHPTFFNEFCYYLGANLAVLVSQGMAHHNLHSANITMAAEFADLGSVYHFKEEIDPRWTEVHDTMRVGHLKDMRDVAYSIKKLCIGAEAAGVDVGREEHLVDECMAGFTERLSHEKPSVLTASEINPETARAWFSAILYEVLVKNQNVPPLTHFPISSWKLRI